ncbi:pyruvate, phosphate dikinase [Rhodohalobacter sulfatireducens]|uniref:Pyruvate, phosphate dikinase n=1 Tax=Rhodohalobacter sulfatireducens TaxID=2911366 RepID=A0ABS9K9X1_9BACT|nr:pyruvate, phosphate dikinase [Rhodohalobacter sulfatireducens]MCG2587644.1 pyruvate, phosphate dikinase [Rhodohalobacter sulfatireducens]
MEKDVKEKHVYKFGVGSADGDKTLKELLGGKGANLAEMSSIGLPVPPGFTITTEACNYYSSHGSEWPKGLKEQVKKGVHFIEDIMKTNLGDSEHPLLLSVRSGAAVSMPGMMDTVLNLGLNDTSVEALASHTNNERFAYDSYRRFIDMFGNVVMGIPHEKFEHALESLKSEKGAELDTDLNKQDLKELVNRYKAVYRKATGYMFPTDPFEQLEWAINAVFKSWDSDRAIKYRQINHITGLLGTGVNVQAMVYGNMGDDCATGVCFTRNPSTGENKLYGEFLVNAQGEDVVAGIRTPKDITELKEVMPKAYNELLDWGKELEKHYGNMQDIEFTIQKGTLYILQTRNGKRTGHSAIKIATDMVAEGLIDERHAVKNLVEPNHLDQLLHPQIDADTVKEKSVIGVGLAASPGAAVGKVVFDSEKAEEAALKDDPVILVRIETSPEDVGGMSAAEGILTSRGGMTSHAAVVARGWGKPCVAGCSDIIIDYENLSFTNGKITVHEGDWISIDGARGTVIEGRKDVIKPELDENYKTFMSWVDQFRDMNVRTNADTKEDASRARDFGAEGIGLCRTEHMFFGEDRIRAIRRMIISDSFENRKDALATLLPYQKADFKEIFKSMDNLPVTIRLLDPPLHEFLPEEKEDIEIVAKELGIKPSVFAQKVRSLREFNPMLGHRGCRLGITYPEITQMQTRAILEAAIELKNEGYTLFPEIMIPLVGTPQEFRSQKLVIDRTAKDVFEELGDSIDYKVGTMIEIPRAALVAGQIAKDAEFFSFGTNDLTQMTFGYSRDDAGKFLGEYLKEGILQEDPFQVLDTEGVGQLVEMATKKGREQKPALKVGICGEHGGEPHSVTFCYQQGLNYVSCSPFRVPVARLAAAQAALNV